MLNTADRQQNLINYSVSGGRLNAYRAVRRAIDPWQWEQPVWTSATNDHGTITASGVYAENTIHGAFNGILGGGTNQWGVRSRSGWIQLTLNYDIIIDSIIFYNRFSGSSHRTRVAGFTGRNGVSLGAQFTAVNSNFGRTVINVGSVQTNIIRLNIASSYSPVLGHCFVGAAGIVIIARPAGLTR